MNAQDILNKEFSRGLRGYEMEDVDNFLTKVSTAYQELLDATQKIQDEVADMESNLDTYRIMENSLKKSLIAAQRTGQTIEEDAKQEAAEMIQNAEEESNRIIAEAKREARETEKESQRYYEELETKANEILENAKQEVERIINESLESSKQIEDQIQTLTTQWNKYREHFFNLLEKQQSVLANENYEEMGLEESDFN